MSIDITARNASVGTVTAQVDGVNFNYEKANLTLADIISTNNKTSTIVITATNEVGTSSVSSRLSEMIITQF